ncbi:kinase-like domain-containing protein [Haematococcus lacustris]
MTPASYRPDKEDQGVFLSAHELHVIRLLGQGAYASVYLASRHDGSTVAVKVLHDVHRQTGCTAQKLFVREALLMNKITHMSILKAHGLYRIAGSHPGLQGPSGSQHKLCFLMEHANGGSLVRLLAQQMKAPWKPLYSPAQVLTWLTDIAEGLQHLHSRNPPLVHRDIKLENILLHDCHEQERMVARITDLGLHVVLGQQRRSLRVSSRSLLQAGLPALPPQQPQQSRFALKPCSQPASTQVSRPASPGLPDACAVSDAACQLSPLPSRQHSFIVDAPTLQHILMSKGDHPFAPSHSTSTVANLLTTFELPSTSSVSGTSGTNPGHWSQASSVLHSSLPDCSAVVEASVDKPPPASDSCSTLDSTVLQQLGRWGDDSAWQAMLAYIDTQPLSRKDWQWVYSLTGQTGSAIYMAPEVHRGEPYNTSADVHSFGILAYELLARSMLVFSHIGTATLPGVTTAEGFAECIADGYRPARPDCIADDAVWSLIEDCWHPDPNTRPSMAALLPRLQQALQARLAAGDQMLQVRGVQAGCTADCSIM